MSSLTGIVYANEKLKIDKEINKEIDKAKIDKEVKK